MQIDAPQRRQREERRLQDLTVGGDHQKIRLELLQADKHLRSVDPGWIQDRQSQFPGCNFYRRCLLVVSPAGTTGRPGEDCQGRRPCASQGLQGRNSEIGSSRVENPQG